MNKIVTLAILLALGGCATVPSGPSVLVLPSQGKGFQQFQDEDARCQDWAARRVGVRPQEAYNESAVSGAVAGTAIGAGLGALLGAASGSPGTGAAFGAGTGLFAGTAIGASSAEVSGYEAQRRYDNAYVQCMYSYGNLVPGVRPSRRHVRSIPPPPPPDLEGRY